MIAPRFWIAVDSQDHVESAVAGEYVEVNHGRAALLERMQPGDAIAYYAPRLTYPAGAPLQAFTALGRLCDRPIYQHPDGYQPFRRATRWLAATPAPIRPLIERLGFIRNKDHWGAAFRFGCLRVAADDFALIASAMGCAFDEPARASVASSTAHAAPVDAGGGLIVP
jgi:hypothetical protein